MTESDALSSGLSAIGNIRAIVFALCLVVLLTVLLIAANSTVMMVREQISDVAVMRALGFSRGAVAFLLFGECGAIGLVGGIIGAGAALWMFSGGITLGAALGGNGALWVTPAQIRQRVGRGAGCEHSQRHRPNLRSSPAAASARLPQGRLNDTKSCRTLRE